MIRYFTSEQHLDMMEQIIKEIEQICTNEDWNNIKDAISKWDNERLEALRIILLAGFKPIDCVNVIDEIIKFSEITPLTAKEISIKLSGIINKLNYGTISTNRLQRVNN
jgi:hypothetical protein